MLCLQVGMGSMDHYECDFEEVLLTHTLHHTYILHHLLHVFVIFHFLMSFLCYVCRWAWAAWTTTSATLRRWCFTLIAPHAHLSPSCYMCVVLSF
jgi:hypothetical protein